MCWQYKAPCASSYQHILCCSLSKSKLSRLLYVVVVQVTHLFRDVLHGWGQILLSVNVSPCAKDYDETSHVLKVKPQPFACMCVCLCVSVPQAYDIREVVLANHSQTTAANPQ